MYYRVLSLFLFLSLSAICKGQHLVFNHLNVENGLSQNSVLAIAQDARGFMWYGNRYGLNRYDGHSFRLYKNNHGDSTTISNDYILSLLCDSKRILWVGTTDGLNRYDPEKDAFERIVFDPAAAGGMGNTINCMYEDRKGTLWIGTGHGLFARTGHDPDRFTAFYAGEEATGGAAGGSGPADGAAAPAASSNALAGDNVHAIYEDHEGYLWVGSTTGLTRMQPGAGGYRYTVFRNALSDNYITTIMEDNERPRHLWIGTLNGGLNQYNASTGAFLAFKHENAATPVTPGILSNYVRKICTDRQGRLWIGTQEGLSILDPGTGSFHSYQHDPGDKQSLSQNSIYSIFCDANGSMWIGTYFGGVNITYSYATPFTVYENSQYHSSISNNVVSAFAEDKNHHLWIGTEGGGLNYFNRSTGEFTAWKNRPDDPSSLGSNLVKAVCLDRDGNVWAGTHGGGLNGFDPVHQRFHRYLYKENDAETLSSEVAAVMEDSQGRLWAGSQSGLHLFTRVGTELKPYTGDIDVTAMKDNRSVKSIFEDAGKNIWVSTTRGLYVLTNGEKSFHPFLVGEGGNFVNANFVNCVREDSKGSLWIGTYYEGLTMYDPSTKRRKNFTEKDGLPNNNVLGIVEDSSGKLWLSTDNGLSRFDINTNTFKNYTASDGLAANEFNYNAFFKDSRGEMFFGGYNGFTSFFPEKIETNNYVAPMVFTSLQLFNNPVPIHGEDGLLNKDISYTDHIRFRYDQNVFTLHFALLSYIKPDKNKYEYRLDGFDKGWNEVTATSATYTSLPAGNYTFWVKGANNDGIWSKPAGLHITILPPFWKTWWAWCIYTLTLGVLLFFIARFFFLRELLKKEEVLHQAKLNFFTNISHEIRTHLALIIGPVEKLLLHRKEEEDRQQLRYIRKSSESLLQLVSELMDFRKAESGNLALHVSSGNIVSFLHEIYTSFQHMAASRNIKTDLICSSNPIAAWFDREQLEKVFFNLLSNAFKFTPDGGTVNILIEEKRSVISIRVIDNGRGIAPGNLEKLFLNYYQENDYGVQNTGYGIGLALSKSIVELHKGSLQAESEMGNRTCFTVTLMKGSAHFAESQLVPAGANREGRDTPFALHGLLTDTLAASHTDASAEALAAGVPVDALTGKYSSNIPVTTGPKATILLVEDNPEVRTFIRETLEAHYQVTESVNGMKGWESAIEGIPDCIISDVMMPEMDGLTLCGKLKTDERTSHIPIILLTARTSTLHQVNGLEVGADIYLTKPFSIHILELHVRNLLSARETMRQKFSREFTLQPKNIVINTMDEQFLEKAIRFIEDNMDDPEFGVQMLSTNMAMSQPVLYKKLKALTDMSVNDFIKNIRLKKAAQLLQERRLSVYEVAYMVGYSDRKYFSKEFKKQFGQAPSEYGG